MENQVYNDWRRDISAEYVLRTGRAYPTGPLGRYLRELLVKWSDYENPPSVIGAVDKLIAMKLLKP